MLKCLHKLRKYGYIATRKLLCTRMKKEVLRLQYKSFVIIKNIEELKITLGISFIFIRYGATLFLTPDNVFLKKV